MKFGRRGTLLPIFTGAIGEDDMEHIDQLTLSERVLTDQSNDT